MSRLRTLDHQIVVRIPTDLYEWLAWDAEHNGRTLAQSVRFYLRATWENLP